MQPEQSTAPPPGRVRRAPGTLKIGQIGGIDVLVRASWLLVALLISVSLAPTLDQVQPGLGGWKYVAGVAFAVLLYLTVLLHEASHALMARHYGLPVTSITLHFLGGVTEIDGEPSTPGQEFGVSVVGPVTSIVVGLVFLPLALVAPHDTLIGLALGMLATTNLIIGVLNLVPGIPLDGGRVLRSVVWRATGNPHRGTLVAGWGGRVCAVGALLLPFVSQALGWIRFGASDFLVAFVIAAFLWTGASQAIVSARVRSKLPALQARRLARRSLTLSQDVPVAEVVRRAQEHQAGGVVLVDSAGLPTAVVNEAAVLATPKDRWPWLPATQVARVLEPGLTLPADIGGEPLIRAMQDAPASEYVLVEADGTVYGVLATDDVDRAFAAGL
jgi:Zn-dependent protease/CBS domain-containing protein